MFGLQNQTCCLNFLSHDNLGFRMLSCRSTNRPTRMNWSAYRMKCWLKPLLPELLKITLVTPVPVVQLIPKQPLTEPLLLHSGMGTCPWIWTYVWRSPQWLFLNLMLATRTWALINDVSLLRQVGVAPLSRDPDLSIVMTSSDCLWITNRSDRSIDIPHGELFGFNLGTFVEVPAGHHKSKVFEVSLLYSLLLLMVLLLLLFLFLFLFFSSAVCPRKCCCSTSWCSGSLLFVNGVLLPVVVFVVFLRLSLLCWFGIFLIFLVVLVVVVFAVFLAIVLLVVSFVCLVLLLSMLMLMLYFKSLHVNNPARPEPHPVHPMADSGWQVTDRGDLLKRAKGGQNNCRNIVLFGKGPWGHRSSDGGSHPGSQIQGGVCLASFFCVKRHCFFQ